MESIEHIPVMEREVLDFFSECALTTFVEGTVGLGGHARALLQAHPEIAHYVGIDRDPEALAIAKRTLDPWPVAHLVQGNFADVDEVLHAQGVQQVNGFFLI